MIYNKAEETRLTKELAVVSLMPKTCVTEAMGQYLTYRLMVLKIRKIPFNINSATGPRETAKVKRTGNFIGDLLGSG